MKKMKKFTSVILASIMAASVSVTGVSAHTIGGELQFNKVDNAQTVIVYADGTEKTFDGVIDVKNIEESSAVNAVNSYEVFYGGKSVIKVELNDINVSDGVGAETALLHGYYAVSFDVEDSKEAFLTGLTANNVDSVQTAIIDNFASGKDFSIESIDFIDTEKQGLEETDSELCWAAATSNVLDYTGWGQKAGYKDADDLFDLFVDSFDNGGNYTIGGVAWFINGVAGAPEDYLEGAAQPKDKNSGGYLTDYAYDKISAQYDFTMDCVGAAAQMIEDLHNGNGVILGGHFFEDGFPVGGHALTCWGYVVDNDYDELEKEHYDAFIVSDSDSDMTGTDDRRTASNKMSLIHLTPDRQVMDFFGEPLVIADSWICNEYADMVITEAISVVSYSDSIEKETSLKATKKKSNTVDLSPLAICIGQTDDCENIETLLPNDADIYISPLVVNYSNKDFEGNLSYRLVITDENGKEVYNNVSKAEYYLVGFYGDDSYTYTNIGRLGNGTYTATVTLNPNKTLREAYYYNNTYSQVFEVGEPAIDGSKIDLSVEFIGYKDGKIDEKINLTGLSEDDMNKIEYVEVFVSYYYEDEDEWDYWNFADEYYENEDDIIPSGFLVDNNATAKLVMRFNFENAPSIYVESDEFTTCYPSVYVNISEDSPYVFSDVEENATEFADGESLTFSLWNTSFEDFGELSGTFHLEAFDGENSIVLTDPVEFSVAYDEETEIFEISSFDYELPAGFYELYIVLDGDFLQEDGFAGMIQSGEIEDDFYFGDVNLDGDVTISDATLVQKYIAELVELDELQLELADVNGDGEINISDATYIQKMIAE